MSDLPSSGYPYDKPGGNGRSAAKAASAARTADAAAVLAMARAARRASEESREQLMLEVERLAEAERQQQAAAFAKQQTGAFRPKQPGQEEARMLRDMFQAVFPDLRGITGASRVVAYSGSLTMSLAFAGFVYWATTRYDKARAPASAVDTAPAPAAAPNNQGGG